MTPPERLLAIAKAIDPWPWEQADDPYRAESVARRQRKALKAAERVAKVIEAP
jgi:hypothetical protein